MNALIFSIVQLLHTVITVYIWIVIISALLSFVRPDPNNPIVQTLYRLTEPVYGFLRKKMPFLIMGGLDLTPLVLILGLQFLDTFMMRAIMG
jgi:YggT family protein